MELLGLIKKNRVWKFQLQESLKMLPNWKPWLISSLKWKAEQLSLTQCALLPRTAKRWQIRYGEVKWTYICQKFHTQPCYTCQLPAASHGISERATPAVEAEQQRSLEEMLYCLDNVYELFCFSFLPALLLMCGGMVEWQDSVQGEYILAGACCGGGGGDACRNWFLGQPK